MSANVVSFLKELDRIQEQQLIYTKKIEFEKQRKDKLSQKTIETQNEIELLQQKTKGGKALADNEKILKRNIAKLENNLQMLKIKYSVAHSENVCSKNKLDAMRQDKVMFMSVKNGIEKEIAEYKAKIKQTHKDLAAITEKKGRLKQQKANVTHQMMSDIEEFARELELAKLNISVTQETILGTIRDRMQSTYSQWETQMSLNKSRRSPDKNLKKSKDESNASSRSDIQHLLEATGASSIQELFSNLTSAEEQIFNLYRNVQMLNEELEKIELENRRLESLAEKQMAVLDEMEGNNDKVKQDLENHINAIQKTIAHQEKLYSENLQLLNSLSEPLMSIMRNVASDEDAMDQQILSAGINDRNIDIYLGVVEQRIDDLIQMSKAAQREPITGDDFVQPVQGKNISTSLQAPTLPSLQDGVDEDDENEENTKVTPININILKEFMNKRVQKNLEKAAAAQFRNEKRPTLITM